MGVDEDRRKAAIEMIRELARMMGKARRVVEEIEDEIVDAVEDAVGVPLTPQKKLLLDLYKFRKPWQPRPNDLKKLIAKYMGLEGEDDVLSYLRSLGRGGTGSDGARGKRPTSNDS